uniref:small monomeric GTPase n=1 Tax=Cyclopterus lumpus TaxID=8103 RepID=A0A8C2XPA7_CYCLU
HTVVSSKMDANIVVMGTESVGKSAITVRLLTRRFIGEYGDIESIYSHSFGREFTLNIWDSPYSETSLFEKKVQWADGYVLVYSICDRASFNSVSRLIQTIKSTKDYLSLMRNNHVTVSKVTMKSPEIRDTAEMGAALPSNVWKDSKGEKHGGQTM